LNLEQRFKNAAPKVEFCSLRFVEETHEGLGIRQDVVQPVRTYTDAGVMITVIDRGGIGYAATPDLSESSLREAAGRARDWAHRTADRCVTDFSKIPMPHLQGNYRTPEVEPWESVPLKDKIDLLREESKTMQTDDKIVDWDASISYGTRHCLYLTTDGGQVDQTFRFIVPAMSVTANEGSDSVTRSLGGRGYCRQGGFEVLDTVGFRGTGVELADEALQLLVAPNCPTGEMDIVLAPDQMILQIHESIGHPLELDRILGDERNYAGRSFVTLDMFGSYRYGSDLLNITYDPSRDYQFATYRFDDEGAPAERAHLIEDGILVRALGGVISQARAGVPGVANSRANSWDRPPIDRMANVNLEPGDQSLDELISRVENGVYMKTNVSWSIDDSRNKFQFGCEWGQRIENGKLTNLVQKPNYRGVSATFWRSLAGVGNEDSFEVLGTPNCGKGEPSQVARAGHAAPACLFQNVSVFGGE